MRRIQILASSAWIPVVLGCQSPGPGVQSLEPLSYQISGIVGETSTPDQFAFGDFLQTKTDSDPFIRYPSPPHMIETNQAAKLDIKRTVSAKTYDYSVLLGKTTTTALGHLEVTTPGEPKFILDGVGWIFAWRFYPFGATRWVSAAAQGSTFLVEQISSTEAFLYYLGPKFKPDGITLAKLPVRCENDGTFLLGDSNNGLGKNEFVKVTDNGTSCSFGAIQTNADAQPIVKRTTAAAKSAGWIPE